MPGLVLYDGQIGDGAVKLRLGVRRDFDSGHPFALDLGDAAVAACRGPARRVKCATRLRTLWCVQAGCLTSSPTRQGADRAADP